MIINKYIKAFILGGISVALINYVVDNYSASKASFINSFPITFTVSCIVMYLQGNDYKKQNEFVKYTILYILPGFLFSLTYYYCSSKINNKYNMLLSLLISILVWIPPSIFIYYINNLLFHK